MDELLEKLAELEHVQWASWVSYMLDNLTDKNIARWRRQIDTRYELLSETEKMSDRYWAKKAIDIFTEFATKPVEEGHE